MGLLSLCLIAELVVRRYLVDTYYYDSIFSIELVLIGVILTVQTYRYVRISQELFLHDFCEEEERLKYALVVFLGTYLLRACLYSLVIFWDSVWRKMWTEVPILTEALFTGSQLIYDIWPIILIMKQHHSTFKNEERYETSLVMDRFTSSTFLTTTHKDFSS